MMEIKSVEFAVHSVALLQHLFRMELTNLCSKFVRCKKHETHCALSADPVTHYMVCQENVFVLSTISEVAIIIVCMEHLIATVTKCLEYIMEHTQETKAVCNIDNTNSMGKILKHASTEFTRSLCFTKTVLTRMLLMKENKTNRKLCSKVAGTLHQLGRKRGKTCLKMLRTRRNVALTRISQLEVAIDEVITTVVALLSC